MATDLAGEELTPKEVGKNRLPKFRANTDEGFYEICIISLPSKMLKVIQQNGA